MLYLADGPLRSSKLLLPALILLLGGVSTGEAYILPPAYPSMSFSMVRMPSYGGSLSISDEGNLRQAGRPQRLIQRLMEQQSQDQLEPAAADTSQHVNNNQFDEVDGSLARKSRRSNLAAYDSYRKFDPNRFVENSPEWNMAMIKYLIDMKNHGHKIKEIETTKPLPNLHKELTQNGRLVGSGFDGDVESVVKIPTSDETEDATVFTPTEGDPVICKMEPFNVCYRLDSKGNMHALGDRRPVRLLRVYKK